MFLLLYILMNESKKTLTSFLKKNLSKEVDGTKQFTHTRIGNNKNGSNKISGGAYYIEQESEEEFYKLYYNEVFEKRKMEYITEKQLRDNGPILIDIDLRYATDVMERQHNENHILDLTNLYLDVIKEHFVLTNETIEIFVLEKPNMNRLTDNSLVKDGIHIIIGIQCNNTVQLMIREEILSQISNIETWSSLPKTNSWNEVFDDGISAGHTNWQMFGSRKPDNEAYQITHYYKAKYDNVDNEYEFEKEIFNLSCENIKKVSARYKNYPKFELTNETQEKYNSRIGKTTKKSTGRKKLNLVTELTLDKITSKEILQAQCDKKIDSLPQHEYYIKETHEYTMALPESYYGPGSYNNWIKVGLALKETSEKLFYTWMLFSSQSSQFKYEDIEKFYDTWSRFSSNKDNPVTYRSIMYWVKTENPAQYEEIRKQTIDYYVMETIKQYTDWDLAQVLYILFKDKYICASIKSNIWYEFVNHRWKEIDSGVNLTMALSKEISTIYVDKVSELTNKSIALKGDDPEQTKLQQSARAAVEIVGKVKNANTKTNIMKEAKNIFYVSDFISKLDTNEYLMCFKNGVIDFKNNEFRDGRPEDFCSKCTNINYIPYKDLNMQHIYEIEEFFKQLFPVPELRQYMWEHSASIMIGTNHNQTFNIYTGKGRNGKSRYVELMAKAIGDYKGTVPITLITQKRNSIGSTSSEIVALQGTRMAVMQEPSRGDKINEGIMKELTGGDPLQGRALFKDSVIFVPQFKLAVCTNHLFDIPSNDDGTWRRIRVCDFMSKFVENPIAGDPDEPYQFPVDLKLNEKFDAWSETLASMLANIAFKTRGIVNDCDIVMARSKNYKNSQDFYAQFISDKIIEEEGSVIMKTPLHRVFKEWYIENIGRNIPKTRELDEYMERIYGRYKQGFHNIKFNLDTPDISGNLLDDEF